MSEQNSTFYNASNFTDSSNFTNSTDSEFVKPVKISVFTPLIYVGLLLTTLIIFSKVYRQRTINKLSKTEPLFSECIQKKMYYDLANMTPKPNDKVLKAALIRWASESVRRTIKLKEAEPYFAKLYQGGSIGDDMHTRFQFAQKFQELEIEQIAQEANSIKPGWPQTLFPLMQNITFNEALERRLLAIDDLKKTHIEHWGFTKEDLAKFAKNSPVKFSQK